MPSCYSLELKLLRKPNDIRTDATRRCGTRAPRSLASSARLTLRCASPLTKAIAKALYLCAAECVHASNSTGLEQRNALSSVAAASLQPVVNQVWRRRAEECGKRAAVPIGVILVDHNDWQLGGSCGAQLIDQSLARLARVGLLVQVEQEVRRHRLLCTASGQFDVGRARLALQAFDYHDVDVRCLFPWTTGKSCTPGLPGGCGAAGSVEVTRRPANADCISLAAMAAPELLSETYSSTGDLDAVGWRQQAGGRLERRRVRSDRHLKALEQLVWLYRRLGSSCIGAGPLPLGPRLLSSHMTSMLPSSSMESSGGGNIEEVIALRCGAARSCRK